MKLLKLDAKKFEELQKDENRFKRFNEIISRLNLSNLDTIVFETKIDLAA